MSRLSSADLARELADMKRETAEKARQAALTSRSSPSKRSPSSGSVLSPGSAAREAEWDALDRDALLTQIKLLSRRFDSSQRRVSALEGDHTRMEDELARLRSESEALRGERDLLQGEKGALEDLVEQLTSEMETETRVMSAARSRLESETRVLVDDWTEPLEPRSPMSASASALPSSSSSSTSEATAEAPPARRRKARRSSMPSVLQMLEGMEAPIPGSEKDGAQWRVEEAAARESEEDSSPPAGGGGGAPPPSSLFAGMQVRADGELDSAGEAKLQKELRAMQESMTNLLDVLSEKDSEVEYLKKELFYSLSVAVKLGLLLQGKTDNYSVYQLYEKMVREKVPYRQWSEWIPRAISKSTPTSPPPAAAASPSSASVSAKPPPSKK